jgi:hypothetical protein
MNDPLAYPNGVQDPGNMEAPDQEAGGNTKIEPTDMSGDSGRPTGGSYDESLASMKAEMPTEGDSGYHIEPVEPELYGDPNNTTAEFPGK